MRGIGLWVAVVLWLSSAVAVAQAEPPAEVVYRRHTVINLDGRTVEGTSERPSGSIILSRQPTRFGRMILVRKSFTVELLGSHHAL